MKKAFADTPGGQIFYLVEGSGEPVLMLHQSSLSSFEFTKVIPLIAKEYQVFAPDTMGYGYSDPAPLEWDFPDYVDCIAYFMDAVGIKKAHLVGHHTGARLATALAIKYPERVNKMVLNGGSSAPVDKQEVIGFYEKYMKTEPLTGPLEIERNGSHAIRMWKWQLRENPVSPLEAVLRALLANWEHYSKQGRDLFCALIKEAITYEAEKELPKIKSPTLILRGTQEITNPLQPKQKPVQLIPGAKYLDVVGGAILFWYDMPELGARIVLDFLKNG